MTDPTRLAVLEANYRNLQKSAEDHERRDEDRFDRTFKFIQTRTDEILDRIGDLDSKVGTLWDDKNQRTGALKLTTIGGHCVTGVIAVAVALGLKKFW